MGWLRHWRAKCWAIAECVHVKVLSPSRIISKGRFHLWSPRRAQVQPQHHEEEALEEEVAVGADGIHLETPWLYPVGGPARDVVAPPMIGRDEEAIEVGIVAPFGIVTDLREPVDGCPPARLPEDELVEDPLVHLSPGRRHVCHERHGVGGVDEVEAGPREHGGVAAVVPVWVGPAVAVPAVGRGGLAVQVAQPADRAL